MSTLDGVEPESESPVPVSPVERARKALANAEANLLHAVKAQAVAELKVLQARREQPEKVWQLANDYRESEAMTEAKTVAVRRCHSMLIHALAEEAVLS